MIPVTDRILRNVGSTFLLAAFDVTMNGGGKRSASVSEETNKDNAKEIHVHP